MIIITEIGLNHMGDEQYGYSILDKLLKSRTDGISFQVREESFYNFKKKKLKLKPIFYEKASHYIKKKKKMFGMALCEDSSFDFYLNLNCDFIKIINNNIKNYSLIEKVLNSSIKKIFISTGDCSEDDIRDLLKNFNSKKIEIVHTQLSHSVDEVNLMAISYLREKYNIPVSFGNHCSDFDVIKISLAFQPKHIFFYIKGKRNIKHPDENHAIKVDDVDDLIKKLNLLNLSVGKYGKFKTKKLLKY